jgi:hypothetical protein
MVVSVHARRRLLMLLLVVMAVHAALRVRVHRVACRRGGKPHETEIISMQRTYSNRQSVFAAGNG